MPNRVLHIIQKDLLIDKREKYAFLTSLLYLFSINFVVFKVFDSLQGATRLAIFWILILFTSINIVSHSFKFQLSKRRINYYQLYDPSEFITAKLITNFVKVFIGGMLLLFMQYIMSNEWPKNYGLFMQVYTLATLGIVVLLSMVSMVSVYSSDQNSLITVLALPLLIPILILSMRISLIADRMIVDSGVDHYLMMLTGIDLILLAFTYIFIGIIWKP